MWSVVVLPLAFRSTGMSLKSWPSHGGHGSISWRRSLLGSTLRVMPLPSAGGVTYVGRPRSKFLGGTSGAVFGGDSLNVLPSTPVSESVSGLNDNLPDSAIAVTISGLPMKFIVVGWPSLRRGKLRLYEVTIVFGTSEASLDRRHWPMHGPQALARTTPLMSLSDCICPSRSMVARTCSEPGVTRNGTAVFRPCAFACSATSAARLMSS